MKSYLLFLSILLIQSTLFAHGDLDKRIKKVSKEIKENPSNPDLYLKRGTLYFQHEEYKKSIKDYKRCSKLGMNSNALNFCYARSYEKQGFHKKALQHLDKVLKSDSLDVKAWRLQGLVLFKEKKYCDAATSYDKVLTHAIAAYTENFLEASKAWEHCASIKNDNAVNVILQGIQKLGPLTVFHQRLVELHLSKKDYTSALNFQNKIIQSLTRKEHATYKRALIYQQAGKKAAAQNDLTVALDLIENLPRRFRKTKAIIDLKKKILHLMQANIKVIAD